MDKFAFVIIALLGLSACVATPVPPVVEAPAVVQPETPTDNTMEEVETKDVRCFPTVVLVASLTKKYDEKLVFGGLYRNEEGVILYITQLFFNPISKTYTIVDHRPDGSSCIIAHGVGGQMTMRDKSKLDSGVSL